MGSIEADVDNVNGHLIHVAATKMGATEAEIDNVNGHLMTDLATLTTDEKDPVSVEAPCFSHRWIIGYTGIIVGTIKNMLQVNISIVIVCMVGSGSDHIATNTSDVTSILHPGNVSASLHDVRTTFNVTSQLATYYEEGLNTTSRPTMYGQLNTKAEFDWGVGTQSVILSAFFYGYMCTLIPCGWLASTYGGKHVLLASFAVSSVVTLLTPILARTHVYLVVAARVVLGCFMASCSPAWMALVGVWSLPTERTRFVALYWIGQQVGTVTGLITSGYLCVVGFDNGWASVFYIHGGVSLLFTCVMQWLVYSNPDVHPRLSEYERRMLTKQSRRTSAAQNKKPLKTPWCSIMKSLPVWMILLAQFANGLQLYLLMTCLPLFVNDVLHFDIQSNGLLSSLPFLTLGISVSLAGLLADAVASRKWLTLTTNRKVLQFVGLVGYGAFIVACGHVPIDQRPLVFVCLCTSMFFAAIGQVGYSANIIDIAPRHSAVIYAVSNTVCCLAGIIIPVIVAALTQNKTIEEWRQVFYLSAGVALAAAIIYALFSSSDIAPWATDGNQEIEIRVDEPPVHEAVETPSFVTERILETDDRDANTL